MTLRWNTIMELVMVMRLAGRAGMKNSCPMLHPPHPVLLMSNNSCLFLLRWPRKKSPGGSVYRYLCDRPQDNLVNNAAMQDISSGRHSGQHWCSHTRHYWNELQHTSNIRRYMTLIYYSADKQTLQLLTNFNNRSEKTYLSTCSRYLTRIPS